MIIVSQDKTEIVNFENMNNIIIEDFDFKDKHFKRINANTDGDYFVLGDYKTAGRAKEVLREIIEIHKVAIPTAVYEMPED